MNTEDAEKLAEISRLLHEAYEHYFTYEGHCKSGEGRISVYYGNFWERQDNPGELKITGIDIYSYVFVEGGARSQYFDSVDEALETVRRWHADEMAYDPNTPEEIENRRLMDEMASDFISKMMNDGRLRIINVGEDDGEGQD